MLADQRSAEERLAGIELGRICSTQGYRYLKGIALSYVAAYQCNPPTTDEEKAKWETYNLIKAPIEHLFREAERLAKISQTPIVEEIKPHANRRRKSK